MKNLMLVLMIMIMPLLAFSADKRMGTIEDESNMKTYNPNAVWQSVPCDNCNGTGSVTKYIRDEKNNRSTAMQVMCPYCKGTGTKGMSKK